MYAVKGIYDGASIKPLKPIKAKPNSSVLIIVDDQESAPVFPPTRVEDVAGCLKYDGPAKTLKEMEDAIEKGVKEHWK